MALRDASIDELKKKYQELFPSRKTPTNNKIFLWKQIAYKLQENEYGGLSGKTQDKLKHLIQEYDPINNKAYRRLLLHRTLEVRLSVAMLAQ